MARPQNDGKGRMGGRAAGTPNKTTAETRRALMAVVDGLIADAAADLAQLEPAERLKVLAQLLPYVCTKAEVRINYGAGGDYDDSGVLSLM